MRNELSAIGKLVLLGTRIVILEALREQILILGHDGHPGIVSMKRRLRTMVYGPGIDREIEKFCRNCYGCQLVSQPNLVQTDSGPQFISEHFRNFMTKLGIVHRRISSYWSPAQGQIKRENRSILKRIRIAQSEKCNWK